MQKNIKISEDNRGFSLLELIVTVVILAIVTAPFLSSFVTASNTNVKSKRIQEANELSQYVIEQCKAMSLVKIENQYGTATDWDKDEDYKIGTDNNYNKLATKYEWTIDSANLPEGYSDKYTADVLIQPVKTIINSNEAIPEIDNLNKKSCAVLKKKINGYDNAYSASATCLKDLVVEFTYDDTNPSITKKYKITYTLKYIDGGSEVGTYSETFSYEYLPSLYILYAPINNNDRIRIVNNIPETAYPSGEKVNVYLMEQNCGIGDIEPSDVTFEEVITGTGTLESLMYDGSASNKLDRTVIYTNIKSSVGTPVFYDKDDTVNDTVKTLKIDTLYDIEVVIKYDGKEVSSFKTTKVDLK